MGRTKESWEDVSKASMVLTGYVECQNDIIREIIRSTNAQTAMLYIIILSHRNTKTNQCFPSRELLSREMAVSDDTIGHMLNALEAIEALKINSGKQHVNNNYYFPGEKFYKETPTYRRVSKFRKKPKEKLSLEEEEMLWLKELNKAKNDVSGAETDALSKQGGGDADEDDFEF